MRVCCQCGVEDHEIISNALDRSEKADPIHFVKPEWRKIEIGKEFDQKYRSRGWVPRLLRGEQGMFRMICVNCINANEARDRVWAKLKADALKLEKSPSADAEYYQMLVA